MRTTQRHRATIAHNSCQLDTVMRDRRGEIKMWASRLLTLASLYCFCTVPQASLIVLTSPSQLTGATTTINFDGYADQTVANSLYSTSGITLGRDDGLSVYITEWANLGRTTTSPRNVLATTFPNNWATQLNINFASPVSQVGAYFGNDTPPLTATLSLFDASNVLVGSSSLRANGNLSVDQFLGLKSSVPFTRARFDYDTLDRAVVIDDLVFQAITPPPPPIPPNPAFTLPTKTPPISFFPTPDPYGVSQIGTFAQSTPSQFDQPTANNLNLLVTNVKPLIDPQSGVTRWLKATASVAAPDIDKSATLLGVISTAYSWAKNNIVEALPSTLGLWADTTQLNTWINADPTLKQGYASFRAEQVLSGCAQALLPKVTKLADAYFCLIDATSGLMADALVPALEKYAKDPPNQNYTAIFQATPPLLASLPSTGDATLDQYFSDTLNNISLAAAYLDAANQSFDRYAGAYQAGDPNYAALQLEAYLAYLAMYDQALRAADTSLNAFGALIDVSQLSALQYDPTTFATLQQQVALSGFSSDLDNYFLSLGFTPSDVGILTSEFLAFNPNSIGGSALDARNLLEDGIAFASTLRDPGSVPEPNSAALVAVAFLMLAVTWIGKLVAIKRKWKNWWVASRNILACSHW